MNVTKKQHYVWQHYLAAWAEDKFYCYRQKDKSLFSTGTVAIANETYFYRLERLTEVDLEYLRRLANKATAPELRNLHEGTINLFQLPFTLRDKIDKLPLRDKTRKDLELHLTNAEKTFGESFHTFIEGSVISNLASLRLTDCEFYREEAQTFNFINFVANQFFRTPTLKQFAANMSHAIPGLDLRRTWLIESQIYAINIAAGIFVKKRDYKFTFITNETPIPFIAGDQPIINLNAQSDNKLRLYYPLSPRLAMIFEEDTEAPFRTVRSVSSIEVEHHNQQVYMRSIDQIYSNDRDYLELLSKTPKDVLAGS